MTLKCNILLWNIFPHKKLWNSFCRLTTLPVSYCVAQQKGITFDTEVSIVNFAAALRTEQVHTCK